MRQKSEFTVIANSSLSSDEWKVLALLYLPILGSNSFTLYHTFYHLLNAKDYHSNTYTLKFLSDLLNLDLKTLKEAIQKLEAINLVNTYKDQNNYVFNLKNPLSPRGFFQDTILGQFLKSEVGTMYFEMLSDLFKVSKYDLSTYSEVTKDFDDVFTFMPSSKYQDDSMYLGRKNNGGSVIDDVIDYEKFVESLPNRLKKPILYHFNTKNKIQKLAYVYKFTIDELKEIYEKISYNDGEVNLSRIEFVAQTFFENKKQTVNVEKIKEPSNDDPSKIEFLKTVSPLDVLEKYAKNDYQLMGTETVMQLLERNEVESGVINALLMHILKYKNGELPHINYLDKVLENWFKQGIKTTEDAYEQIIKREEVIRPSSKQVKKSSTTPSWVYDYLEKLDQDEE
ncbi:MAG: DnaD domain protein [Acholeplasmataceae bacterium]